MGTVIITEFKDFLDTITEFENKIESRDHEYTLRPVYRGVCEPKGGIRYLKSSLERETLVRYEYTIIKEMKRLQPKEFANLKGKNLIEKMRHYEFPARILDFSLSPYVALYFALQKTENNINNKIYCMAARENNMAAESIAQISETAKPYMLGRQGEKITYIEDILFAKSSSDVKKERLREFLILVYGDDKKSIFTYPQIMTERERNQQSIFMIFSNEVKDVKEIIKFEEGNIETQLNGQDLLQRIVFTDKLFNRLSGTEKSAGKGKSAGKESEILEEIIIDSGKVEEFKKILDNMGINETFLFPDSIEQTSNQIKRWIKSRKRKNAQR